MAGIKSYDHSSKSGTNKHIKWLYILLAANVAADFLHTLFVNHG